MKFSSFADLFKSPLTVVDHGSGVVENLELDLSREPDLALVNDWPDEDDIPVALVALSDGGGAFGRFDSWPPQFSTLEFSRYGHNVSKDNFVRRVNALLATV